MAKSNSSTKRTISLLYFVTAESTLAGINKTISEAQKSNAFDYQIVMCDAQNSGLDLSKLDFPGLAVKTDESQALEAIENEEVIFIHGIASCSLVNAAKFFNRSKNLEGDYIVAGSPDPKALKKDFPYLNKVLNRFLEVLTPVKLQARFQSTFLSTRSTLKKLIQRTSAKDRRRLIQIYTVAKLGKVEIVEVPVKYNETEIQFGQFLKLLFLSYVSSLKTRFSYVFKWPFAERSLLFTNDLLPKWRFAFALLIIVLAVVMPYLARDYGPNSDEHAQHLYGDSLLKFYMTGGKDKRCNVRPTGSPDYGGLAELSGEIAIEVLRPVLKYESLFEQYQVRHMTFSLFGLTAILFTGLIAFSLFGWRAAFIASLLLTIHPRFFGHAMFTAKDVGLAAGFAICIYYMLKLFKEYPRFSLRTALLVILGIAYAINIRVGGVLLICYLGLFGGLRLMKDMISQEVENKGQRFIHVAKYLLLIIVIGFYAGMLVWPYGMEAPIEHVLEQLKRASKHPNNQLVLFSGEHMRSIHIPWYFMPKWLLITSPLGVLLGFFLSIVLFPAIKKKIKSGYLLIVAFTAIFPIAYAIYNESVFYSDCRQMYFTFPCFVALAAVVFEYFIRAKPEWIKYLSFAVLGASLILPMKWMIQEHRYDYVYFNPLAGGLKGAYANYDTDYYQHAMTEAAHWIKSNLPEDVHLSTNCFDTGKIFWNDSTDKSETKLSNISYAFRSVKDYDYGIFNSRYIDRSVLINDWWPPVGTIHTIEADGVPLMAIVKNDNKNAVKGYQNMNRRKWQESFSHFNEALKYDSANADVYAGIANIHLAYNRLDLCKQFIDKCFNYYPRHQYGFNVAVHYYMRKNDKVNALAIAKEMRDENPKYGIAYYNLGWVYKEMGNTTEALKHLNTCIKRMKHKPAYDMIAQIYQDKGDVKNAQRFRKAGQNLNPKAKSK